MPLTYWKGEIAMPCPKEAVATVMSGQRLGTCGPPSSACGSSMSGFSKKPTSSKKGCMAFAPPAAKAIWAMQMLDEYMKHSGTRASAAWRGRRGSGSRPTCRAGWRRTSRVSGTLPLSSAIAR